jgi:SAM-dependent methyltransferase
VKGEQYDPAAYGERIAQFYDRWHPPTGFLDPAPVVAALRDLAGRKGALELGVGTGRVAIPLAESGVAVVGIEASPRMAEQLRAKPGGDRVEVVVSDFATAEVGRRFGCVYAVFNTLFALPTQELQLSCFAKAARHLTDGGCLVLECYVPNVGSERTRLSFLGATDDDLMLEVSQTSRVDQTIQTWLLVFGRGRTEIVPFRTRFAWPAELDLLARLAGLELESRWGSWDRRPFTETSTDHVSVYRRLREGRKLRRSS